MLLTRSTSISLSRILSVHTTHMYTLHICYDVHTIHTQHAHIHTYTQHVHVHKLYTHITGTCTHKHVHTKTGTHNRQTCGLLLHLYLLEPLFFYLNQSNSDRLELGPARKSETKTFLRFRNRQMINRDNGMQQNCMQ